VNSTRAWPEETGKLIDGFCLREARNLKVNDRLKDVPRLPMNVFIKANYSFDHRFGSALSLIPRGEYRSRVYAILVSWKNPRHGVRVDEKIVFKLRSRCGKRPLSCGFNSSNSTKMALHKNGTPFENLRNLDFHLHAPAHTGTFSGSLSFGFSVWRWLAGVSAAIPALRFFVAFSLPMSRLGWDSLDGAIAPYISPPRTAPPAPI
jgi:hypothetical protein